MASGASPYTVAPMPVSREPLALRPAGAGTRERAGRNRQPFGLNRCSGPGKAPLCTSSA